MEVNVRIFDEALGIDGAAGIFGHGGITADTIINSTTNLVMTACVASMLPKAASRDKPSKRRKLTPPERPLNAREDGCTTMAE